MKKQAKPACNFIINEVRFKLYSISHKVALKIYKQTSRIILERRLLLSTVLVRIALDV